MKSKGCVHGPRLAGGCSGVHAQAQGMQQGLQPAHSPGGGWRLSLPHLPRRSVVYCSLLWLAGDQDDGLVLLLRLAATYWQQHTATLGKARRAPPLTHPPTRRKKTEPLSQLKPHARPLKSSRNPPARCVMYWSGLTKTDMPKSTALSGAFSSSEANRNCRGGAGWGYVHVGGRWGGGR